MVRISEIGRFTGLNTLDQNGSGHPGDIEFVTTGLFEFGDQLLKGGLHADGAEHFDLGGAGKSRCAIRKTAIAARRPITLFMTSPLF